MTVYYTPRSVLASHLGERVAAGVAAAADHAVLAGTLAGERVAGAARAARHVTPARVAHLRARRTEMVLLKHGQEWSRTPTTGNSVLPAPFSGEILIGTDQLSIGRDNGPPHFDQICLWEMTES